MRPHLNVDDVHSGERLIAEEISPALQFDVELLDCFEAEHISAWLQSHNV
jgi:hypothetical protein